MHKLILIKPYKIKIKIKIQFKLYKNKKFVLYNYFMMKKNLFN